MKERNETRKREWKGESEEERTLRKVEIVATVTLFRRDKIFLTLTQRAKTCKSRNV